MFSRSFCHTSAPTPLPFLPSPTFTTSLLRHCPSSRSYRASFISVRYGRPTSSLFRDSSPDCPLLHFFPTAQSLSTNFTIDSIKSSITNSFRSSFSPLWFVDVDTHFESNAFLVWRAYRLRPSPDNFIIHICNLHRTPSRLKSQAADPVLFGCGSPTDVTVSALFDGPFQRPGVFIFDSPEAGAVYQASLQRTAHPDFLAFFSSDGNRDLRASPFHPFDVFSASMFEATTVAYEWHFRRKSRGFPEKPPPLSADQLTDIKSLLFSIVLGIAADLLDSDARRRFFRKDVFQLFVGFALASRILIDSDAKPVSIPELPSLGRHWLWNSLEIGIDYILNRDFSAFRETQSAHFKSALDADFDDCEFLLDLAIFATPDWMDSHLLAAFVDRSPSSIEFAIRFEICESLIRKLDQQADDALLFCLIKVFAADPSIPAVHPELPSTTRFLDRIAGSSVGLITILTTLAFNGHRTDVSVADRMTEMLDWRDEGLRVWTMLCYGLCVQWQFDVEGWELKLLELECRSELEELAVLAVMAELMQSMARPLRAEIWRWFEVYGGRGTANFLLYALRFWAAYLAMESDPEVRAMEMAKEMVRRGLQCEEKVVREYAEECGRGWRMPAGNGVFEYAAKLLVVSCLGRELPVCEAIEKASS